MPVINGKYYTIDEVEEIKRKLSDDEFDKFLVSGVVAAATGSALAGLLIGGSAVGGILGDALFGSDDIF